LFVRYSRNALAEERGFHYSTTSANSVAETSANTPFKRENHSAVISVTRTLNPTTVLDARLGLARFLGQNGNSIGANYDLASLGFASQFVNQAARFFPKFNWSSYEGAGSTPMQNNPGGVSVIKMVGKHSLKTGVGFVLQRVYQKIPGFWAGNFSFDPLFTGRDPLRTEPGSGNSLASFLL